ncbi:unnamed protein product [Effrenium voratum]|nr:unnamed protein product [Effrenium voratum]
MAHLRSAFRTWDAFTSPWCRAIFGVLVLTSRAGVVQCFGSQNEAAAAAARGALLARPATLLVAGLARDAEAALPGLRRKLEGLAEHFFKVHLILVENDSADGTQKYLRRWAQQSSPRFTVEPVILRFRDSQDVGKYGNRGQLKSKGWGHDGVKFLAKLRNIYLRRLREFKGPHWILMIDVDIGHWEDSRILEALGHETHWHVLCAHSWYRTGALYDAFALRSRELQPAAPGKFEAEQARAFFPHGLCGLQDRWGESSRTLIPVDSCFGGLALYREELLTEFKDCNYSEDVDDCEHVSLHTCIRAKGGVVALYPRLAPRASASNSTCCVETCEQADRFPMAFLPFQPQFQQSRRDVAGLLAAGLSFEESGKPQEALAKYMEAATPASDRWAARASLLAAFLLVQHRHPDQGLRLLKNAAKLSKSDPRSALVVAHVYEVLDDLEQAGKWLRAVDAKWPPALFTKAEQQGAWLKAGLAHLPATHLSQKQAAQVVAAFVDGISGLVTSEGNELSIPAAFDTRAVETTRLVYLGPELVPHLPEVACIYSRLHLRLLQGLGFTPDLRSGNARRSSHVKIRVGFVSGLFTDSAVGNLARGIIWPLPSTLWVSVISLGRLERKAGNDSTRVVVKALLERADHVEELNWEPASPGTVRELQNARAQITALDLDFLVFLEIGLEVRSFVLAHSRLAPLQLVTYGHASTTGIPTVDFFVSLRAFEHDTAAQARYSEQLLTLPGLPYFLPSTVELEDLSDRQAQWKLWRGMLEGVDGSCQLSQRPMRVFLVAQTLYKVVPEFDEALVAILSADPRAVVAIRVGHPQPSIHRRIARRLASQLEPSAIDRLCFLPMQNATGYFWILRHASVLLDTFPHGGHTTTLDTISVGAPLVFLASAHLAGGFAAGLYDALDGEEGEALASACCAARTVADYVEKALRLAREAAWRKKVSEWIRRAAPKHVFYRTDAAEAWANLFLTRKPPLDHTCVQGDQLWEYLQQPDQFSWKLFPVILRPRSWFSISEPEPESLVSHQALWPRHYAQAKLGIQVSEVFVTDLAGHDGLTPTFCCTALPAADVLEMAPQMKSRVRDGSWYLGLAQHSGRPEFFAIYLLTPSLQLAALSVEFCLALNRSAGTPVRCATWLKSGPVPFIIFSIVPGVHQGAGHRYRDCGGSGMGPTGRPTSVQHCGTIWSCVFGLSQRAKVHRKAQTEIWRLGCGG